jgi:heme oxygenase
VQVVCGRLELWLLLADALGGQQQYVVEGQCLGAAVINQDA